MLTSITLELWKNTEKDLGYYTSGPKVLYAITIKQQQVNYSAVCTLVQALQKMRLTYKPGKYVEQFDNKMAKMARQISRAGSAPIEISTLVDNAFIDCEVLDIHSVTRRSF